MKTFVDEQELLKEKAYLEKRLSAINILLDSSSKNDESDNISISKNVTKIKSDFPIKGTNLEQFIYIIKDQDRFLYTAEIADLISPYFVNKDKKWLIGRISSVLSEAKRSKKVPNLVSIGASNQKMDNTWGAIEWLDEKGNIIPNHMYKKKEIIIKKI